MSWSGRGLRSKTRIVLYLFNGEFDETAAERILEPAKKAGTIHQYDTGRGNVLWFEGPPGAEIRALRERVKRELGLVQEHLGKRDIV